MKFPRHLTTLKFNMKLQVRFLLCEKILDCYLNVVQAQNDNRARTMQITKDKKKTMACLFFLMQIVVGNKFAIPYFRLFMDVVNVSFGINNPARKKYLSKVHNGTTKNKMSVFTMIHI